MGISSVVDGSGTHQSKATVMTHMTETTPVINKTYVYDAAQPELFEAFTQPGVGTFESARAIAFVPGSTYTQAQIDAYFQPATFTSITPATGSHLSTTATVIRGSGFSGVSGVHFGANAGTSFSVISDTEIHVTAPTAGGAGAVNVIIHDDDGDVTATNAFTYS